MLGSILKAASESEPRPSGSGQCGAGVLPAGSATSGRAWVGGNIGCSLLDHLQSIQADDVVVLELSSFQLEDLARLEWSPHIAIITNLKPNHLDRHGTFEAYTEAKMNIVRYQRPGDRVFIPAGDDDLTERVARAGGADRLRHFSPEPALAAALRVPGRHNQGNAAAAAAAARAVGVAADAIQDGLKRFTGLPHRLEFVAERQGVRYFNDSKSTTPESARIALQAFDAPVIMLVGGYDKKIPLDDLCRDLAVRAKAVVCYGQTAGQFAAGVRSYFGRTHATMIAPSAPASVVRAGTLEEAVQSAHQFADPGDVVVLSPACASYDQFSNYEERGETFRRLVQRTAEGM